MSGVLLIILLVILVVCFSVLPYLIGMYAALTITNVPGWTNRIALRLGVSFWIMYILGSIVGGILNAFLNYNLVALTGAQQLILVIVIALALTFLFPLLRMKSVLAHFGLPNDWKNTLNISLITYFGAGIVYILIFIALYFLLSNLSILDLETLNNLEASVGSIFPYMNR